MPPASTRSTPSCGNPPYPDRLPAVLGCDGAGVAEAVGGDTFNRSLQAVSLYGRLAILLQSPFDAALLKQGRLRNASVHYVLMLSPLYLGDRGARIHQRRIWRPALAWSRSESSGSTCPHACRWRKPRGRTN